MASGLAGNRLAVSLTGLAKALWDCGVSADRVVLQVDNQKEMFAVSCATTTAFGMVVPTEQLYEPFVLHGFLFEVRNKPKVWRQPKVQEWFTKDQWGRVVSIPNR